MVDVLTRDFGRVRALARGVREERSKLRFALLSGDEVTLSLVKGRNIWRIVGAEDPQALPEEKEDRTFFLRVLRLSRLLLQGEEANHAYYDTLHECRALLKTPLTTSDREIAEVVVVLKLLHALGYVSDEAALRGALATSILDTSALRAFAGARKEAIEAINTALRESGL